MVISTFGAFNSNFHFQNGIQNRWSQEEVGVALGTLTEGSIEKANQDVKETSSKFVARVSMENIHKNALTRMSWEADPLLHYEETVGQAISSANDFLLCNTIISGYQKREPEKSRQHR